MKGVFVVSEYVTGTGQRLTNVHPDIDCKDRPCCIHHPSNHSMVSWPTHWRDDKEMMERICIHGIGHPDPDNIRLDSVHGCDGCCSRKVIQGEVIREDKGIDC